MSKCLSSGECAGNHDAAEKSSDATTTGQSSNGVNSGSSSGGVPSGNRSANRTVSSSGRNKR